MVQPVQNGTTELPSLSWADPIGSRLLTNAIEKMTANISSGPTSLSRGAARGLDDPRRSIEDECGYPPLDSPIASDLFRQLFDRNGIANRIVQMMPKQAFQKSPLVYETDKPDMSTPFEEAFDLFGRNLGQGQTWHAGQEGSKIWDVLLRGLVRSRIGRFGGILALLDDGKNLQEPVDGLVTINWKEEPIKKRVRNLVTNRMETRIVGVRRYDPVSTPVMPDHVMTMNELQALRNPQPRKVWVRFDPATNQHVYKEIPAAPYSKQEKRHILKWFREARQQAQVRNVKIDSFNPPHMAPLLEVAMANGAVLNAPPPNGKVGPFSAGQKNTDVPPKAQPWMPNQSAGPQMGPTPMTVDASKGQKGPLLPNNTFPEPYQTGQFNPFGQMTDVTGVRPNGENPQAKLRPQEGSEPNAGDPAIPGAYGTDKLYGTSDGAMSAGYGMAAPSGYGQLSGTDQQYFGVQIGPSEQPAAVPTKQQRRVIDTRVYDETLVQVVRYEWNINNPRFGMPVMYRVTLNDPRQLVGGIGLPLATVFVHWSRFQHITDRYTNSSTSPVFADPVLQPVLENVLDIRKVPSAAAEGYWQSGIPTWVFNTHQSLGGDVLFDPTATQNMMEMAMNSLQKWIAGLGGEWDIKAPPVTDPTKFVEAFIELICIYLGCPVRVFKGSERGELASSQDDSKWNDEVRAYQNGYVTPWLICPFIDWMIMLGVLPPPESYKVEWPDLDSMSKAQKAQVMLQRTQAWAAATQGGVIQQVGGVKNYATKFDDMTDEEADTIEQAGQQQMEEDQAAADQLAAEQGFQPKPPDGYVDPEQQDREHEQAMAVAKNPPPQGAVPAFGKGGPPGKGPPGAASGGANGKPGGAPGAPVGKGAGPAGGPGAGPGGGGAGGGAGGGVAKPPASPAAPAGPSKPTQPSLPAGAVPGGGGAKPKLPLRNRLLGWFGLNSNPEGHNQYTGGGGLHEGAPHEIMRKVMDRASTRQAPEDRDASEDHAAKVREALGGHSKEALHDAVRKSGFPGVRPGDSKAGIIERVHSAITAQKRAHERAMA